MKKLSLVSLFAFCIIPVLLLAQGQSNSKVQQRADTTITAKFALPSDSLAKPQDSIPALRELKRKDAERKGEKPFVTVEQMPSFPEGEVAMQRFIAENLKYPKKIAMEEGLCTRSTIRFVVEADGSITDIKSIRSCSDSLDKEVIRVIEMMPKWIPGKQNGKAVPVYFTLPMHWHIK